MTGKLAIVNLGLARVNARRIVSLEELSKEAKTAALAWDAAVDMTLRSHPWGFASATMPLPLLGSAKPERYAFAYLPPADCLAVRKILPSTSPARTASRAPVASPARTATTAPFEMGRVGGTVCVLTDVPDAVAEYTRRTDNPALWDSQFADALAWRLAGEFAAALKSDYEAAAGMFRLAAEAVTGAETSDARESVFDDDPASGLERARWG